MKSIQYLYVACCIRPITSFLVPQPQLSTSSSSSQPYSNVDSNRQAFASTPTISAVFTSTSAFGPKPNQPTQRRSRIILQAQDLSEVQEYISQTYPEFTNLIKDNDDLWKQLSDADSYTIFAPTSQAFSNLGSTKLSQLDDPRNLELKSKVGMYHVITEQVTAMQLFNAGGVVCMGGEVPIERGTEGFLGGLMSGFMGNGGEREDGSITVGGAKVVQSVNVGNGVVHEVDGLVSPNILWRYADQLRIPGSK